MTQQGHSLDLNEVSSDDGWNQLTQKDQEILAPKLTLQQVSLDDAQFRIETPQEAFNRIVDSQGDLRIIASRVVAVKNLIDNAGGRSNGNVWQEIRSIDRMVTGANLSAGFDFKVNDGTRFLEVLENNGFDVDRFYEMAIRFVKKGVHAHSARFITKTSLVTGMHITQSAGAEAGSFSVHWDRRSTAFNETDPAFWTKIGEQYAAAQSHKDELALSPWEVRRSLIEQGIVPTTE